MGIFSKKKQNNENAVIKENLQKCSKNLKAFYLTAQTFQLFNNPVDEFHRNTNYLLTLVQVHLRTDYEHYKGSSVLTEDELRLIKEISEVSMVSEGFPFMTSFYSDSISENEKFMVEFGMMGMNIANAFREDIEKWKEKIQEVLGVMEDLNEACFDVAGKKAVIMIEYEKGRVANTLSREAQLDYTEFRDRYELSVERASELSKDFEELQEYIYEQSLELKCPK